MSHENLRVGRCRRSLNTGHGPIEYVASEEVRQSSHSMGQWATIKDKFSSEVTKTAFENPAD